MPDANPIPKDLRSLAEHAMRMASEQLRTSVNFKRTRMDEIGRNVDEYYNRVKKPLRGRINIPVPVMGGFVDTILAKQDEPIGVSYEQSFMARYRSALKVTAAWEFEKARGNWDRTDRGVKKQATFSGVGIYKVYSTRPWRMYVQGVHYADFHCEPMGGQDLENHLFLGQTNIIRTIAYCKNRAKAGAYDKGQVALMEERYRDETYKNKLMTDLYDGSLDSFRSMGMNVEGNLYIGQPSVNLTEWCMEVNGTRYYLVFDYKSQTWVRFCPLTDEFPVQEGEEELWPFIAWHTHEDAKLFWSKAPCDDMRPVSIAIRMFANQEMENRARRNAGQRLVDPRVINDLSQLPWQSEGIVIANTTLKPISEATILFETPELNGTINLINWLDNYTGAKVGVTKDTQGGATTVAPTVNVNNIQQNADRVGLTNKSYASAHRGIAVRFLRALREDMDDKMEVKIMGPKGYELHDLTSADLSNVSEFDVKISSNASELQANMVKRKERSDKLMALLSNIRTAGSINPDSASEHILSDVFDDDDVRALLDTSNYQDRAQTSKAAEENEAIMTGKTIKPYRGANAAHLQYHLDFAMENDLDEKQFAAVMAHLQQEQPIAISNTIRQTRMRIATARLAAMAKTGPTGGGMQPPAPGGAAPVMPSTPEAPAAPSMPYAGQ